MRRLLALCLALCLLCGLCAPGARAAFIDDEEIENREAVSMLVILGVLSGYSDGTFRPSAPITRAETAKMLCVMINGGKDPKLELPQTYTFTDIAGNWAARYIEYAASIGIVSGYGDGRFGPEDGVTGQHLSKMLLVSLNYDPEVEGLTGAHWAENIDALAQKLGLYAGLGENFDSTRPLTRGQTAQIFANALYVDRAMYQYSDEEGVVSGTRRNSSLMESTFKAEVNTGVVVANGAGWLSLPAQGLLREGEDLTVIDTGLADGASSRLVVVSVRSGIDVLGRTVTVVARRDGGEAYGYLDSGVNRSTVLRTAADFAQSAQTLEQEGLNLDGQTPLCVNGQMRGVYAQTRAGEVTRFIDYNGDGAVDVALQSRPYVTVCLNGGFGLELADLPATGERRMEIDSRVSAGEPVLCEVYGGVCHVRPCRSVTGKLESLTADMGALTVDGRTYTPSSLTGAQPLSERDLLSGSVTLYLDDGGYFVAASAAQ